ncbi:tetratricopeptide repeat protein [Streptomyces megasporus]|uniref:tetratricopeptide repeat protein n=1 Tax=Streptomyces megasporus TaxID=44060 RepID=UPI00068D6EAD|nr:tetratricopeptide repeat protein [Streptomyces megasporus]
MTTPDRRLAELVARLRGVGMDPTAEEIAEAVWLALRLVPATDGTGEPPRDPDPAADPPTAPAPPTGDPAPHLPSGTGGGTSPDTAERTGAVSLYAPARHGTGHAHAFPVRAPSAKAASGVPALQRALRPLHGYRPPPPHPPGRTLDEEATAERVAREGVVRPVFRPAARQEREIRLLMDATPTTSVWQSTLDRLRQACEQLGVFRDVRVHYLHPARDGTPLIGTGPDPAHARPRAADRYRDTTGRRLTLVVSDCVGPLWQSGGAQRLLHRWSAGAPLAVVQPLPPRLWRHTALPAEPGALVRETGGAGGVSLGFVPDGYGPVPPPGARSVPVLPPTPQALGSWARLLGAGGPHTVRGAAAWVLPHHPARPVSPPDPGARTPEARLRAFRAGASPGALELAVHLAAVPLVLPVIRLVQETMLPHTGPTELAEVLLGGLLERLSDLERSPGPRYAFAPGVRERLLPMLDRDVAVLLLKHVSEYVAQRFGQGTRNFPALAVARLTGRAPLEGTPIDVPDPDGPFGDDAGEAAEPGDELFAEVPARVVRWYQPVRPVPDLLDEAERLLVQWRSQRDREPLRQARALAESALDAGGGERARLLLGRTLRALAQSGDLGRDLDHHRRLLRRAVGLLTGSGVETALERAAAQYGLWLVERDPERLLEAEETLRAVTGEDGPPPPEIERTRRLRLGRVLLELARVRGGASREAAEAARELRAACDLLDAAGAAGGRRCAALLDLVAALRLNGERGGGLPDLQELLELLDRAEAAADGDDALLLRCLRARAAVHHDAGDWEAADRAYAEAESRADPDSPERCELLLEWGGMLLDEAGRPDRAEGLLREALTNAPDDASLQSRLHLLLGRALVGRYRRERFLPDLYEGCHLLERAARKAPEAAWRAEAWLALGEARADFPEPASRDDSSPAEAAWNAALREAREAAGTRASATAARALRGRGFLYERLGRPRAALADHRAAEAEWRRLAEEGTEPPEAEVREVRARVAERETE